MRNERRRGRREERATADHHAPGRLSTSSLLFLGLVLGLIAGLYYAWVVDPIIFVDASPARFNERYRAEYIFLVSQSYAADGDWERAEQRLAALDDPVIAQTVADLLEVYLREQRPADVIHHLAVVAQRLGAEGPAVALFAPTPPGGATATATPTPVLLPTATWTPTATPSPTETARPSVTPTSTPRPSPTSQPTYRLLNQERACPADESRPHIEVVTLDALLNPLPGVEVLVNWEGGADHFFTGFKPAGGASYGDFTMTPDVSYTIVLADGSPEVSGLRIEPCDNGAAGGWRLTFQNLQVAATETPES